MEYPIPLAIKAKNYKSFGDTFEGFDNLYRINVIIGRNNSGKSALLDLIRYVLGPTEAITTIGHRGRVPEIHITKPLTDNEIRQVFRENESGGVLSGHSNFYEYGKQWEGKPITVHLQPSSTTFVKVDPPFENDTITNTFGGKLANVFLNPIAGRVFRRLLSDRNIAPEGDASPPSMTEDGRGATNVIQHYMNKANRDHLLVEFNLLNALNKIFNPDANFKRIMTRQHEGAWEIYLEEENKGLVSLSNSGSGLKTVILVLINLLLIPELEGKKLSDYVFAFEELENNLHPGLQRHLLSYLRETAKQTNCCVLLSTHSNVIIDLFSKDEEAQIIHVTHNGECANAKVVKTYVENKGILDDLDVRASDLLQANGVVWLEGPSDRLYFNRWVELWTEGHLKEGTHYQCVFYGGRLLSHLSVRSEEQQETIDILNVNKNALLVIDSDKARQGDRLNTTKQRLVREIEAVGGKAWITAGREIENYIHKGAINTLYSTHNAPQVRLYDKFKNYLDRFKAGEGEKYQKNKVLYAEEVLPGLTKQGLSDLHDVQEKMEMVISEIKKWNSIS